MIKAVIFDCFGVLTSDGLLPFRKRYFGDDQEKIIQAVDIGKRVDAGLADYDDLIKELARLANKSEEATRSEIESNVADEELFTYIRDNIKPRYVIGMLSNAGANWLDELFQPWQVELFDGIALSYQIGVTKPAPEAYHAIANTLGVLPEECLFIDDQQRYVFGATDIGMRGLVFTSTEQFIHNFEEMISSEN